MVMNAKNRMFKGAWGFPSVDFLYIVFPVLYIVFSVLYIVVSVLYDPLKTI